MKTIDFSRSLLRFRTDYLNKPSRTASHKPPYTLNNAVISIECRCRITDLEIGAVQQFVLGASRKTERVGVEREIWCRLTPLLTLCATSRDKRMP